MNKELHLVTRWLMLFGTSEVPAQIAYKTLRAEGLTGPDYQSYIPSTKIKYYSVTDRPDYYQLTQEGLDMIARGE